MTDLAASPVASLALAMVVTSLAAAEIRNLRWAAWAYVAQALLLVAIFVAIAIVVHNYLLLVWAVVALITKATLIPYLVFRYIRRTGDREVAPWIGARPSAFLAIIVMIIFYQLVHRSGAFLAATPAAMVEPYRTTLAVALTIFTLGLYTMASRRDAVKTVVAVCLMENGVHLSLVSLAPEIPEMPIVGIATEVFITVWMLLYIIERVHQLFGTTDTAKLDTLRG